VFRDGAGRLSWYRAAPRSLRAMTIAMLTERGSAERAAETARRRRRRRRRRQSPARDFNGLETVARSVARITPT